jgi:TolB-like protein
MTINKTIQIMGAFALLATGGCTAVLLDTAAHNIFVEKKTNFTEKNYAAADYLIQQAKSYINRYAVITAQPLSDIDQPGMSSTFGKMVPEQIGVRLSQLGYTVDLDNVAISPDLSYLKPAEGHAQKTRFVLTGTFLRKRNDMDVSLRMIDTRNSQVVAVFDYTMPLTREVADLAKPQAQIIRLPEQN